MKVRRRVFGVAAAIALAAAGAPLSQAGQAPIIISPMSMIRASVILGKQLYLGHCAGCHGRNLQGAAIVANRRTPMPAGERPLSTRAATPGSIPTKRFFT